jgi:hypothetical protein
LANLPYGQLAISSIQHLVNLTFHELTILSNYQEDQFAFLQIKQLRHTLSGRSGVNFTNIL